MVMTPSDSSRGRIIMSKYILGNQKHLTLNDRIYIENELAKETTFKDIAAFLCKDPTTISKEVRARLHINTITTVVLLTENIVNC